MRHSVLAAISWHRGLHCNVSVVSCHSRHSMIKCEFCGLKTTDVGRSLARTESRTHTPAVSPSRPTDSECDLILQDGRVSFLLLSLSTAAAALSLEFGLEGANERERRRRVCPSKPAAAAARAGRFRSTARMDKEKGTRLWARGEGRGARKRRLLRWEWSLAQQSCTQTDLPTMVTFYDGSPRGGAAAPADCSGSTGIPSTRAQSLAVGRSNMQLILLH